MRTLSLESDILIRMKKGKKASITEIAEELGIEPSDVKAILGRLKVAGLLVEG